MAAKPLARFSLSELQRYDGKEGRPSYVAYKGKVYDVSGSGRWTGGKHLGRHSAGDDLSQRMINAPHNEGVLERFPVVGELAPVEFRSRIVERIEALHLHPMIVHFSEACPILAAFFLLLYLVERMSVFEVFSAYLIVLGFFSAIGCMASGFLSWTTTYERTMTRTFALKILSSSIMFAIIILLYVLGLLHFTITESPRPVNVVHVALVFSLVPVTVVLGHYGGKIVYG